MAEEEMPDTGTPAYWQEMWKRQLARHQQGGGTATLHSKSPEDAPEGFLRLGYAVKYPDEAQGPNYLYIRPEWVTQLLPRHGTEAPHVTWKEPGRKENLYASIDDESYEVLQKAWETVRGPFQLPFPI